MTLRRHALTAAIAVAALACGSTTETSASPQGSGGGTTGSGGGGDTSSGAGAGLPEPNDHRPVAMECSAERPAGGFIEPMADNACQSDSDCAAGDSGRCVANLGQPSFCSYDTCAVDADCGGSSICECRNPAAFQANVCVHGSCQLDADCGPGGYCSPSAVTIGAGCAFGIEPGSVGYFCHTSEDACTDDADCGGDPGGSVCLFVVGTARWSCHELLCVG